MSSHFTFHAYAELLDALQEQGLRICTISSFIDQPSDDNFALLRHDVEWGTSRSLRKAQLEADRGIQATYYFHGSHRRRVFVPDEMRKFQELGHEVGFHYETLDLCNGDYDAAERLFAKELEEFRREGFEVPTVCQHGNPRKKKIGYRENGDLLRNRLAEFQQKYQFRGEAYYSIDRESLKYVSDVGIRFADMGDDCRELIRRIRSGEYRKLYFLTHPDYWSASQLRASGLFYAGKALRTLRLNRLVATAKSLFGQKPRAALS